MAPPVPPSPSAAITSKEHSTALYLPRKRNTMAGHRARGPPQQAQPPERRTNTSSTAEMVD